MMGPVAYQGMPMAFGGAEADLTAAATQQVDRARRGVPLASLRAEVALPAMLTVPDNDVGAYLRVAYWLGAAARPTVQGQAPNGRLLSAADTALRNAATVGGYSLVSLTAKDANTVSILDDGRKVAESAGRTDAAAILWSLRSDARDAPDQPWYLDPAGRLKAVAAGGSVLGVIAAVGLGGAMLWLLKPYADVVASVAHRDR